MFKSKHKDSGKDKDTIEMDYVKLRSYSNEVSDVSDCTKEENDTEFVLTDLLSFSWQIARGMVGYFKLVISHFRGRISLVSKLKKKKKKKKK